MPTAHCAKPTQDDRLAHRAACGHQFTHRFLKYKKNQPFGSLQQQDVS